MNASKKTRYGSRGTLIFLLALSCGVFMTALVEGGLVDRTTILYGVDPNIKFTMTGRAGNLDLQSADTAKEGYIQADYQKGSGYVKFNRQDQILECRSHISYTLNRMSKHIQNVAPKINAAIPSDAELDFRVDVNSMGLGSLNFADLHISKFKFDVNYGDVDIDFPTQNKSIVRGQAKFHLMTGDLEITNLANLMADKVKINGGIGEVSVDFGPKILRDMHVKIDQDIGSMDVTIPTGTKVIISGTSRDLSSYGFQKVDKKWHALTYHERSPTLYLKLKGPFGDLSINWK